MLLLNQSCYKNIKSHLLLPMTVQVDSAIIQSTDFFNLWSLFSRWVKLMTCMDSWAIHWNHDLTWYLWEFVSWINNEGVHNPGKDWEILLSYFVSWAPVVMLDFWVISYHFIRATRLWSIRQTMIKLWQTLITLWGFSELKWYISIFMKLTVALISKATHNTCILYHDLTEQKEAEVSFLK